MRNPHYTVRHLAGMLLGTLAIHSCYPAILRMPIERSANLGRVSSFTKGSLQQPIIAPEPSSSSMLPSFTKPSLYSHLTKNFTHELVYFTEISIGTPSQTFSVLLDISSPETFVTSINCKKCYPGDTRYDSTKSRSSTHNGTALEMDYGYLYASGNVTADDFNINSIQVKGQPFLEATTVQLFGLSWDDLSLIHGMLGLAPSNKGSTLHNPSLFVSMASQDVLDQNVLSMRLREPCGITFGSVDSRLFTGDITRIPLTNRTGNYALNGTWQAETRYMTLGNEPGLRMPLAGYTASFSTLTAFIFLPDPLAVQIIEMLEFEDIMFLPPSVECEKLKYLPDITFNLAGKNFTLTPYDYTIEWPIEPGNVRCVSAIMPFGIEQNESIVLGSAFLRAFYSVFDLDTNTIGFASLSAQT